MSGVIAAAATVGTALGATGAGAALVGGLAIASVATSAAGLGYTIASGEDAKRKQADSLARQQKRKLKRSMRLKVSASKARWR